MNRRLLKLGAVLSLFLIMGGIFVKDVLSNTEADDVSNLECTESISVYSYDRTEERFVQILDFLEGHETSIWNMTEWMGIESSKSGFVEYSVESFTQEHMEHWSTNVPSKFSIANGVLSYTDEINTTDILLSPLTLSDFVYEMEFQVSKRSSNGDAQNIRPILRWQDPWNYLVLSIQHRSSDGRGNIYLLRVKDGNFSNAMMPRPIILEESIHDENTHILKIVCEDNSITVYVDEQGPFEFGKIQDEEVLPYGQFGVKYSAAAGNISRINISGIPVVPTVSIKPVEKRVYKQVGNIELDVHVFQPFQSKPQEGFTALVLFFGGGWVGGEPYQLYRQAAYLSLKGYYVFLADYRVRNRHNNSTIYDAIEDGKSAIRWVREHADEYGINPERIIAGGGSSGGHVAACTAILQDFDNKEEDLSVSSKPNAMILLNAVYDTTSTGYINAQIRKDGDETVSPYHHITEGLPPTLVFHGTADPTVMYENSVRFVNKMKDHGNDCELSTYEGAVHGFFHNQRYAVDTMGRIKEFIDSLFE